MEKDIFLKIRKQIDEELKITSENIHEKSLLSPILASRYCNILILEKQVLNQLDEKKQKIYRKLYHKYKYDYEYSLKTKHEIETYVFSDDIYLEIVKQCKEQELCIEYFEEHIKIFNKLNFVYNTYLGFMKIKQGD